MGIREDTSRQGIPWPNLERQSNKYLMIQDPRPPAATGLLNRLEWQASEPDLAYILVETLIFETERVALAFRAWTLLKRLPKPVQQTETHTVRGKPGKNNEHTLPQRTPTQGSRLPRMREPQSHRRLRPRRDHLPRLWISSVPEPDESRTRMAGFYQGGKG